MVNPAILDSYTPEFIRCAEQLRDANKASALFEVAEHPITRPPQTVALNRFPVQVDDAVAMPSPHTDYGASGDTGWRSCPQPCVIQSLVYLQAAGTRDAGNTHVWPGSHRNLAREYLSDPVKYEWMEALATDPGHTELVRRAGVAPVEVTNCNIHANFFRCFY